MNSGQFLTLTKLPGWTPHRLGADFHESLTIKQWRGLLQPMLDFRDAIQWWAGDLLNAGERFTGLPKDEFHSQEEINLAIAKLMSAHQVERDTVLQWARVARQVRRSTRVLGPTITWAHHREVAPLTEPQQKYWLKASIENGWHRQDLSEAIRASAPGASAATHNGKTEFVPLKWANDFIRNTRAHPPETMTVETGEAWLKILAPMEQYAAAIRRKLGKADS